MRNLSLASWTPTPFNENEHAVGPSVTVPLKISGSVDPPSWAVIVPSMFRPPAQTALTRPETSVADWLEIDH